MKNVKHTPYPTSRQQQKATKHHALHVVNPAGTKFGNRIQKVSGIRKDRRTVIVFHGGELDKLNRERAAMRRAR